MKHLGFIGLGVMGEPMCRNLARGSLLPVTGFDRAPEPLARLATHHVAAALSIAALATVDVLFLCLPSGAHVESVASALFDVAERPGMIVDMGTSPVALTRTLAARAAERGAIWVDAPIARTRQAAEDGTLSIMVGAEPADFAHLHPLLACMASDITLCGPVGSGQAVKILNNMVLVETVGRKTGKTRRTPLAVGRRDASGMWVVAVHGLLGKVALV